MGAETASKATNWQMIFYQRIFAAGEIIFVSCPVISRRVVVHMLDLFAVQAAVLGVGVLLQQMRPWDGQPGDLNDWTLA